MLTIYCILRFAIYGLFTRCLDVGHPWLMSILLCVYALSRCPCNAAVLCSISVLFPITVLDICKTAFTLFVPTLDTTSPHCHTLENMPFIALPFLYHHSMSFQRLRKNLLEWKALSLKDKMSSHCRPVLLCHALSSSHASWLGVTAI